MGMSYSRRYAGSNKTNNSALIFVGILFFIIGVAVVFGGVFFKKHTDDYMKTAKHTKAEIVDIVETRDSDGDTSHSVYVTYTVNGKTYEYVSLGYYSSTMRVGQNVDVYYQEDNPGYVMSKSGSNIASYIMWGLGGIFAVIGLIVAISGIVSAIKKKSGQIELNSSGTVIWGEIANVVHERLPDGIMGFSAECVIVDSLTGQQQVVRSKPVATDISSTVGSMVEIYVNSVTNEYNVLLETVQPKTTYR